MLGNGRSFEMKREYESEKAKREAEKAQREYEKELRKKSVENIVEITAQGFLAGVITDIGVIIASSGDSGYKKMTPRFTLASAVFGTALYAYRNFSGKAEDDKASANSTNRAKRKNE